MRKGILEKKNIYLITAIILLCGITSIMMGKGKTKLTYLEYYIENDNYNHYIELKDKEDVLEQSFFSPYEILNGVAIKIGTFSRDNNSRWRIEVIRREDGKSIFEKEYNASLIEDNSFHFFKFDKNIIMDKSKEYILRICPTIVDENTSITYYVGNSSLKKNVLFNGVEQEGTLCFSFYGGDIDNWWRFYYLLISFILFLLIIRCYYVLSKGKSLQKDKLFGAMVTFVMVIFLLSMFSVEPSFTDERDNIRGGMVVARGGVVYRDYITQHMPLMYYISGVFALLGAKSIQQFRLLFYIVEAFLWSLLFIRHKKYIGGKKLILLAASECLFAPSIIPRSYMVFSEVFQGICLISILLEFIGYLKDRKIGWDRSIVVASSVFGCIGTIFLSVYPLFFVFLCMFGLEATYVIKNKLSIKELLQRYYKVILCLLILFSSAIIYFLANHSLKTAFEQFYLFNREVYPFYTKSFGENVFAPFVTSVQNLFNFVSDEVHLIIVAEAKNVDILKLVILIASIESLVAGCLKKRYYECICLFLAMIFVASRGWGFHAIAAWNIAIMIITLYGKYLLDVRLKKIAIPTYAVMLILSLSIYVNTVASDILYKQEPITEMERNIVELTQDNEEIIMDAYCCDSIYLLYKKRFPRNRLCYMLAWYMDWYEQDTIDDLRKCNPKIVIYNPDQKVWDYQYYSYSFYNELKKNYSQLSDNPEDDWKYKVWIKNN